MRYVFHARALGVRDSLQSLDSLPDSRKYANTRKPSHTIRALDTQYVAVRAAYEGWVEEAGGRSPMTGQAFNERIRKLPGVGERMVRGARMWTGLGLMATARLGQGAGEQAGASES